MSDWTPSTTMLKISKIFVTMPSKPHYCCELTRELKLSQATVRSALRVLKTKEWLEVEAERHRDEALSTHPGLPRMLYRITGHGLRAAYEALSALQLHGSVSIPVSS